MPWTDEDTRWMRRAIDLARQGDRTPGRNPIGCVIVLDGNVIGEGCNEVDVRHDATAHAEIVAMRRAGDRLACNELRGAVLYTGRELRDAVSGALLAEMTAAEFLRDDPDLMQAMGVRPDAANVIDFGPAALSRAASGSRLIEALRSLRMVHHAGWIAQRWADPAFPRAFPWVAEPRYWEGHVLDLLEQSSNMREQPLLQ